MGSIQEIFSENLVALRKQRGFTQEMLAEIAGLSLTGVQQLEAASRWPEISTARKLATALTVDELRLFEMQRPVPPSIPEALAVLAAAHGLEVSAPKRRRVRPPKES